MAEIKRISPKKEANRLSDMLRLALGEDRFPIDVAALALEVSGNFDDPIDKVVGEDLPGFEGMLRAHRRKPVWHIIHNLSPRYPGRERFTVAHEFGHYMLHRPPLTAQDYRTGTLQVDRDYSCLPLQANAWREEERQREEEADTFASYLLMPIDDYREQVADQDVTPALLNHITERYGVSLIAACIKWIEFTDQRAAMVVARDGFAQWGRASEAAYKSGIFVRSGMEIPEHSLAGRGRSAVDGLSGAADHPIGVWTFNGRSEPARELTIFSERFDISISLLQFEDGAGSAGFEENDTRDTVDHFNNTRR